MRIDEENYSTTFKIGIVFIIDASINDEFVKVKLVFDIRYVDRSLAPYKLNSSGNSSSKTLKSSKKYIVTRYG